MRNLIKKYSILSSNIKNNMKKISNSSKNNNIKYYIYEVPNMENLIKMKESLSGLFLEIDISF